MSSIGFNFAHINAQQERLREKNKLKEDKSMQAGEKRIDGVKRGVNKKIHPAASRSTDNGGNLKNK